MPALANARHEAFAQGIVGKLLPARTAYVEAGYVANDGNASRMKGNEKVKERMSELKDESARAAKLTRGAILGAMLRASERAEELEQSSAAIRGYELLGKEVAAMFKDKGSIDLTTRADAMSDSELQERLAVLLSDPGVALALSDAVAKVGSVPASPALPDPGDA